MVELIKHDYKLLIFNKRSILIIAILIPILMIFLEFSSIFDISMVLIGLLTMNTNKNSSILLNSIPNNKKEIVVSKYISTILNAIFISIYLLLMVLLLGNIGYSKYILNFNNITILFIINFIYLSLYIPISFMCSETMTIFILVISFLVLDPINEYIASYIGDYNLVFAIITFILLISSFFMSLSVFNEREFS